MLRLPDFEYEEPETVREATDLLTEHGREALPVAGGTDVFPKMKRRQMQPAVVVNLSHIEGFDGLRDIKKTTDGLRIGALTSLDTVANDVTVHRRYPGVAQAVESIATPHHRRMGTVGGNLCQDTRCYYYDQNLDWREGLGWCRKAPDSEGWPPDEESFGEIPCRTVPGSERCWAVFASDSAPALIAHEAEITLVGPDGERRMPLSAFYEDNGIDPTRKRPDELVTAIDLPSPGGMESIYLKYSQRESFDFPSVGVAAAIEQETDGTISRARVVLGAVSTHPVIVEEATDLLVGSRPTELSLDEIGQAAKRAARPMDNNDVPPAQRNQIAAVYTKRAISELIDGDISTAD